MRCKFMKYYVIRACIPTNDYKIIESMIPPCYLNTTGDNTSFVYAIARGKKQLKMFKLIHNMSVFAVNEIFIEDSVSDNFEELYSDYMLSENNLITSDDGLRYRYGLLLSTRFEATFNDNELTDSLSVAASLLGLQFGHGYCGDLFNEKFKKALDDIEYKDIGYPDINTLPFKPMEVDMFKLLLFVYGIFY